MGIMQTVVYVYKRYYITNMKRNGSDELLGQQKVYLKIQLAQHHNCRHAFEYNSTFLSLSLIKKSFIQFTDSKWLLANCVLVVEHKSINSPPGHTTVKEYKLKTGLHPMME